MAGSVMGKEEFGIIERKWKLRVAHEGLTIPRGFSGFYISTVVHRDNRAR